VLRNWTKSYTHK